METIDDEVTAKALDFMARAKQADKPFFLWYNSTRMHIFTHLKAESPGKTGLGVYADGMVEHDAHVGEVLAKLAELGLDENTIVMYSTDNGSESFSWPDGGTTMFRGEKATQWEGGYRVPTLIRWPGVIKPGTVSNEIASHEDMLPTLLAAAGDTTVKEDLLKGRSVGGTTYKVHLDGYNLLPALKGGSRMAAQRSSSTGPTTAASRRCATGTGRRRSCGRFAWPARWQEPFTKLRAPMLTNLRMDPSSRTDIGMDYDRWFAEHMFMVAPAAAFVGRWLQSFREFPPRQKPGSFNLDNVMDAVTAGSRQ